ncbi:MAG: hypothetical protein ABSD21_12780 [Rhizomicrobium sp.]
MDVALLEGRRGVEEPALKGIGDADGLLLGKRLPELRHVRFQHGQKPGAFVTPGAQFIDPGT